jgi:hypothetical protein
MKFLLLAIVPVVLFSGCTKTETKEERIARIREELEKDPRIRQLNRQLEDSIRDTQRANKELDDFIYGKGNTKPVDVRIRN